MDENQGSQRLSICRECLSGGGRILLGGSEAGGHCGPGVLLNLGPEPVDLPHSIISRAAYWAGGIEVRERAGPASTPILSLHEIFTTVTGQCMDT